MSTYVTPWDEHVQRATRPTNREIVEEHIAAVQRREIALEAFAATTLFALPGDRRK